MIELNKNPYAGVQHETDEDGMPWWGDNLAALKATVKKLSTPAKPAWWQRLDADEAVGVCSECGADTWNNVCTYCADHWR